MFFSLFQPAVPEIDGKELALRLKDTDPPELIDVREPHEFVAGRLPGARLIPLGQLPDRLGEIPRDRPIVLICRSGNRSAQATRFLQARGYQVLNLQGGMLRWSGPVESGPVADGKLAGAKRRLLS